LVCNSLQNRNMRDNQHRAIKQTICNRKLRVTLIKKRLFNKE